MKLRVATSAGRLHAFSDNFFAISAFGLFFQFQLYGIDLIGREMLNSDK